MYKERIKTLTKRIYNKYRTLILYVIMGGLTTVINAVFYWFFSKITGNVAATAIAWFIAVIFAFLTNKFFVFESRSMKCERFLREFFLFIGCRLFSGGVDLSFMYITVDLLGLHGVLMKIISDVFITIINFVGSRFFIFKKGK